ncbi:hypothetical protein [Pseudorhodoferax sp. Leaf267]|uniref:hypothetical protein n=1 Tax=Pseudorhodoferax sp. Leaf267 TaxID=1736316 RepID=UPI0007156A7D|nr:hypothetical protein [Pseudorhodoferax sp. Leaf267]KQP22136.1 hypothetical protein ASF43_25240 [Pseudorhodoferax sp. Leaf267]
MSAAALAGSATVWAQGCSLINKGVSEVRDATGAVVPLPAPQIEACNGLRVVKGTVVACTVGARGRSACKTFQAGQQLSQPNVLRSETASGAWYTLADILKGSPGRVSAVSRGRSARSLPTGTVAMLQPVALAPAFETDPAMRGTQGIEVREGGEDGPLVATLTAKGTRTLATRKLKPGLQYSWRIHPAPGDLPLTGEFTLLGEAERRQAGAEAERVQLATRGDAAAQAVMWAGWLASRRCEHEAAQVLSQAGFDVE